MSQNVVSGLLILVGLVNFAPMAGMVSIGQLESMYGIQITDSNLQILMSHRALMFGLLGGLVLWSAFRPSLQPITMLLAFVSMVGFIVIAFLHGNYNSQLEKVILIDVVALGLLILAMIVRLKSRNS